MKNLQSSIVIGIMCFFLSCGIAIQVASIKNESTILAKQNTENKLRNEVISLKEEYNKEYKRLEQVQKTLESLRKNVSNSNVEAENLSKELVEINNFLGMSSVKGKGIVIQLEEGDLLLVLNALNNAGAEAISINDKRIVFSSEILNDGDIVSLDGITLEKPYTINVIGSDTIYGAITMPESYIDKLKQNGYKVSVEQQENIIINKYDGVYNFNFAKNIE